MQRRDAASCAVAAPFAGDPEKRQDVRNATERTRGSYRKEYGSADEVYQRFHSDLRSEPAQRISRESRRLGLPTFEEVKVGFDHLAHDVGVRSSGE